MSRKRHRHRLPHQPHLPPQATYLLTLITNDGRQRTVRLLKQSDMFGN